MAGISPVNTLVFNPADYINTSATAQTKTGALILGVDPGSSELLRLGGSARINGSVTSTGPLVSTIASAITMDTGDEKRLLATGPNNATHATIKIITASANASLYTLGMSITNGQVSIPSGALIIGTDPIGIELLRVGGGFRFTADSILASTTDATSATAAALVISGGAGIGKRSFLGTIGSTFKGNVVAGVQDGTAAVSGQSGEVLSSTVTGVAAAATGTVGDVASLALSPGDWLISAHATISGGATGLTSGSQQKLSVVTTSATDGTEGDTMQINTILALSANGKHALSIPQLRVNISSATTIYLTSSVTYAAGSPTAAAKLRPRKSARIAWLYARH
jgi:hypothetical protein